MERVNIAAIQRGIGKGPARRARVAELIPAVLYGKSCDPQAVAVGVTEFKKVLKSKGGINSLIDLSVGESSAVVVRVKDYQVDPIRHNFRHIDFQAVNLKEKIVVEVPIHFSAQCIGVKEGGILEISRRNLAIRCLPTAIPQSIEVDISTMEMGQNLHANDVILPAGVEFPHSENFSIAQVVAPQKEVEVTPADGEAIAAGAVPATSDKASAGEEGQGEKKE